MQHPGHMIRLRSSARTHKGRVRENNEDSLHLWAQSDHVVVATVADGMGGAVAGEEASRIAVEAIQSGLKGMNNDHPDAYESINDEQVILQLKQSIRKGNNNIIEYANTHPEMKGMGTTLTMAFIRGTQAIIGHVGDSRAYLVDGQDGHVVQITADHSFVQALVAAGHINEEQAEEHPMRNVLYRALGQTYDVEVDIYYERLRAGDWLVLCTDGLTLHVRPAEIAKLAAETDDPDDASRKLVDLANKRGGRDNVSVIVIKAEAVDEADSESVVDHDQLIFDPYDDEETVANSPGGFGPSESDSSPNTGRRDGRTDRHKESPGMFSSSMETRLERRNGQHGPELHRKQTGDLGEGRDLYRPDQ